MTPDVKAAMERYRANTYPSGSDQDLDDRTILADAFVAEHRGEPIELWGVKTPDGKIDAVCMVEKNAILTVDLYPNRNYTVVRLAPTFEVEESQ